MKVTASHWDVKHRAARRGSSTAVYRECQKFDVTTSEAAYVDTPRIGEHRRTRGRRATRPAEGPRRGSRFRREQINVIGWQAKFIVSSGKTLEQNVVVKREHLFRLAEVIIVNDLPEYFIKLGATRVDTFIAEAFDVG